jgi:hypothetical protein
MHGKSRSGDDKGDGPETTLRTMTRDTSKYKIGDRLSMALPKDAPPGHAGGLVSGTIIKIEPVSSRRYLDVFRASVPSDATAADAPRPGVISFRTGAGRQPPAPADKAAPAAAAAAAREPARCAVAMMMSTAKGNGQRCAAPKRRDFPPPTTAHGKIALMPLGLPMGMRVSAQALTTRNTHDGQHPRRATPTAGNTHDG